MQVPITVRKVDEEGSAICNKDSGHKHTISYVTRAFVEAGRRLPMSGQCHRGDRRRYVNTLRRGLKLKGHLIIATFAIDGPPRCSGLDVMRYSPESLSAELGSDFRLIQSAAETHQTPFSTEQKFIYCLFEKS